MPVWYFDLRPPAAAYRPGRPGGPLAYAPPPVYDLACSLGENDPPELIRFGPPPAGAEGGGDPARSRERFEAFRRPLTRQPAGLIGLVFVDVTGHPLGPAVEGLGPPETAGPSAGAVIPADVVASLKGFAAPAAPPAPAVPAPPATADGWLADPVRASFGVGAAVNALWTDTESIPPGVAVVLSDPPPARRPWLLPGGWVAPHLALETPDRVSLELARWLYSLPHGATAKGEFDGLMGLPGRLRELPPSFWGPYSPQRRFIASQYAKPRTERYELNTVHEDFFAQKERDAFNTVRDRLCHPPPGPGGERPRRDVELITANLVYALRLCRKLATRTLEGKPFECTVVFVHAGSSTCGPVSDPARVEITRRCRHWVRFDREVPPSFLFTDRSLKEHMELIQAEGLVLFAEIETLRLVTVAADSETTDLWRGRACRRLAGQFDGVAAHIRGGRCVEVYDKDGFQLWYDGFSWQAQPFAAVAKYLDEFFSFGETPPDATADARRATVEGLTGRMIAAFVSLLDQQASSILAFVDREPRTDGGYAVRLTEDECGPGEVPVLRPMRRRVESWMGRVNPTLTEPYGPIKEVSLSAVHGMLSLDGVHVIDPHGAIVHFAQKFDDARPHDGPGGFSGTGRAAAEALSARIPRAHGLVVKVSASGGLHMFVAGREVAAYRPLRPQEPGAVGLDTRPPRRV